MHLDPHLPARHVRPSTGWINDPNGPIEVDGTYHLFCQYNPDAGTWGRIHWAHFESTDLVRWRDLGIALAPDAAGPDTTGCWSGCAIATDAGVTLVYTGVERVGEEWRQSVCLAHSSGDLVSWTKDPANPVIAGPPEGLDVVGFRDPYVWRAHDGYRLAIGAGTRGVGGVVLLYRSHDLRTWEYLGPLSQGSADVGDGLWTGTMWECPHLLFYGDRVVLVISVHDDGRLLYPAYSVGRLEGDRFVGGPFERLDFGGDLYAPAVTRDHSGRYLAWGWCWEGRQATAADAWAGVLSYPRVLTLDGDRLVSEPAPELTSMRGRTVEYRDLPIEMPPGSISPAEGRVTLADMDSPSFELELDIDPGRAMVVGISVRCSPDRSERTSIGWDRYRREIRIVRERSSTDPLANAGATTAPYDPADGRLRLRLLADHSLLELFLQDGPTLTQRVYPGPASTGVEAWAYGGQATVVRCDWWDTADVETHKEV